MFVRADGELAPQRGDERCRCPLKEGARNGGSNVYTLFSACLNVLAFHYMGPERVWWHAREKSNLVELAGAGGGGHHGVEQGRVRGQLADLEDAWLSGGSWRGVEQHRFGLGVVAGKVGLLVHLCEAVSGSMTNATISPTRRSDRGLPAASLHQKARDAQTTHRQRSTHSRRWATAGVVSVKAPTRSDAPRSSRKATYDARAAGGPPPCGDGLPAAR